jgi:DNA polymerase II small subunit
MSDALAQIIRETVARGYQIEPKAFSRLQQIPRGIDLFALINEVMKRKGEDRIIRVEDIEHFLEKDDKEVQKEKEVEVDLAVNFKILQSVSELKTAAGVIGYQRLFLSRYKKLLSIIKKRMDSSNLTKISEISGRRSTKVAGLVYAKNVRKSSATIVIEDDTDRIEATAFDQSVIKNIQETPLDSAAVATITSGKKSTYIVESLSLPDIAEHVPNTSKKRVYAALTSDLHVGNTFFLKEAFQKFINWLNMREEDIAARLRYLLICGDIVDGVGVYPNQDKELETADVTKQLDQLTTFLKQIPSYIQIFICPGNHEPVRQALPQPPISISYVGALTKLPNIHSLSNPAWLELEGVRILMYHGRSIEDIVATTPGLSVERPALAMKILLKARHVAPVYGRRTPILPAEEDLLVIDEVPDIFHSGHVHILDSERYRGCLILNSGTWQTQTSYQLDMGINPTPAILPIIDLSTLETVTMDFSKQQKTQQDLQQTRQELVT